jgi:hypothetical protein
MSSISAEADGILRAIKIRSASFFGEEVILSALSLNILKHVKRSLRSVRAIFHKEKFIAFSVPPALLLGDCW